MASEWINYFHVIAEQRQSEELVKKPNGDTSRRNDNLIKTNPFKSH